MLVESQEIHCHLLMRGRIIEDRVYSLLLEKGRPASESDVY